MKTAQEKAKELVSAYQAIKITTFGCGAEVGNPCIVENVMSKESAKECAKIALRIEYDAKVLAYNELSEFCPDVASQAIIYAEKEFEQVKTEIDKI